MANPISVGYILTIAPIPAFFKIHRPEIFKIKINIYKPNHIFFIFIFPFTCNCSTSRTPRIYSPNRTSKIARRFFFQKPISGPLIIYRHSIWALIRTAHFVSSLTTSQIHINCNFRKIRTNIILC